MRQLLAIVVLIPAIALSEQYVNPVKSGTTRLDRGVQKAAYDFAHQVLLDSDLGDWSLEGTNSASYAEIPCLVFDGVADVAVVSNSTAFALGTNDFEISFWANPGNFDGAVIAKFNSTGINRSFRLAYEKTNQRFQFVSYSDGTATPAYFATAYVNTFPIGEWHHVRFVRTGTTGQFYKDGVATSMEASSVASSIFTGTDPVKIGFGSAYFGGSLFDVAISCNGCSMRFPLEEYSGTVAYNVYSTTNNAAITSPTAGIATMRAGRRDGTSYTAQYGFRLNGSVNTPALLDGSIAADGNPITNPGGFVHNAGAYSLITYGGVTNTYSEVLLLSNTITNSSGMVTGVVR